MTTTNKKADPKTDAKDAGKTDAKADPKTDGATSAKAAAQSPVPTDAEQAAQAQAAQRLADNATSNELPQGAPDLRQGALQAAGEGGELGSVATDPQLGTPLGTQPVPHTSETETEAKPAKGDVLITATRTFSHGEKGAKGEDPADYFFKDGETKAVPQAVADKLIEQGYAKEA